MNQGYFQSISTSQDENEFTFWIENHAHHPEVLSLLVERYASDLFQLGNIWFYDNQHEDQEINLVFLFEFVQAVFIKAKETISDFNGQESVGIWLYEIAVKLAKVYRRRDLIRKLFVFLQQEEKSPFLQRQNESNLSVAKEFKKLTPQQRLIITLRHAYGIKLDFIANIIKQDDSFVQYELAKARQKLFKALEPGNAEQEFCSYPDYKYILQAHYDGLLQSNGHMPWELENHLAECKGCNEFHIGLNHLGGVITNALDNHLSPSFDDPSEVQFLVENIEKTSTGLRASSRRVAGFARKSFVSFVTIVFFLTVAAFIIQRVNQDAYRDIPLISIIPQATPTSYLQLSSSFNVISVEQAELPRLTSIHRDSSDLYLIGFFNVGYCTTITQNESIWLPVEKCKEIANERYRDWVLSNKAYKWFYTEIDSPVKHIKDLVFSPDGDTLVGVSIDSLIHFWQAENGLLLDTTKLNLSIVNEVVYSPEGNNIAIGLQNGTVTTLTYPGRVKATLHNFGGPVFSLDYSPDGNALAVGGKDSAWSFDTSKGKNSVLGFYRFPENQVISIDFSPDGKLLAFGLNDGTITLYRFDDATLLTRLQAHEGKVTYLAFSPDGHSLASGGTDGKVILWDISNPSSVDKSLEINHPDWIMGLIYSPDGTLLATASLGNEKTKSGVYLWNASEGNLIDMIPNDGFFTASSIAFSPDGRSIAIGSTTGSVKLWQVPHTN